MLHQSLVLMNLRPNYSENQRWLPRIRNFSRSCSTTVRTAKNMPELSSICFGQSSCHLFKKVRTTRWVSLGYRLSTSSWHMKVVLSRLLEWVKHLDLWWTHTSQRWLNASRSISLKMMELSIMRRKKIKISCIRKMSKCSINSLPRDKIQSKYWWEGLLKQTVSRSCKRSAKPLEILLRQMRSLKLFLRRKTN